MSGDDRATAYPGNAVTCEDAGLAGEILEDVEYFMNVEGTHVVIVSVPEGFEVTGTVIKGGNAYNVYGPGDRIGLHAPLNDGGQIPQISHWYVCGQPPGTTTTTTTTTTTESTTSDTSTTESTTSESESTSGSPGESTTPGGGDSSDVSDDELAETGFSSRGLLVAGGGLLLLGVALLFGVRASRRQS